MYENLLPTSFSGKVLMQRKQTTRSQPTITVYHNIFQTIIFATAHHYENLTHKLLSKSIQSFGSKVKIASLQTVDSTETLFDT